MLSLSFLSGLCRSNVIVQNEHLLFSHFYNWVDGFVYLEEDDTLSDSQMSASSVIHKPKHPQEKSVKIGEKVSTYFTLQIFDPIFNLYR